MRITTILQPIPICLLLQHFSKTFHSLSVSIAIRNRAIAPHFLKLQVQRSQMSDSRSWYSIYKG
jgi:hypothetical protein